MLKDICLNEIKCYRLSNLSVEKQQEFFQVFYNKRNSGLVEDLFKYKDNHTAVFYVVVYRDTPLLYFSLGAGVIFKKEYVPDDKVLIWAKKLRSDLFQYICTTNKAIKKIYLDRIITFLEKEEVDDIVSAVTELEAAYLYLDALEVDACFRVYEEHSPAIELVQFCVNDDEQSFRICKQIKMQFKMSIGEISFWRFIVPLAHQVSQIIGASVFMIYAADPSADKSLVAYYISRLKMCHVTDTVALNKPWYDLMCKLLVQSEYKLYEYAKRINDTLNVDIPVFLKYTDSDSSTQEAMTVKSDFTNLFT